MPDLPKQTLRLGTRTSNLARWQTNRVVVLLREKWPGLRCEIRPFTTKGDKTLDKPLPQIGGKGLFTAELEQSLRDGDIDVAIHSLKDLPTDDTPGLIVGAVCSRADTRDGLVARNGWTLATLPDGAIVGTSSNRRKAQLLARRPDLRVESIRGNVETRVRKVLEGEQYHAAVLAAAGLQRLDLTDVVAEWLDYDVMLPAPGQGALAVQCRADDEATLALLATIDDADVRAAVTAERTFLNVLQSGCSAPVAAHAVVDGRIHMDALVGAPDGSRLIRVSGVGAEARALGRNLAQQAIAQGAGQILRTLRAEQPLHRKRVVVTRPLEQARSFHDLLADQGAEPLVIPAIRIEPMPDMERLDEAITHIGRYDWVIFTSVNGVKIFCERLTELGCDAGWMSDVAVATVGASTAQALAERGISVAFTPDKFVAEEIADGLGDLTGKRVLLPVARLSRETLPDMLAAQGAQVERLDIYDTLPARLSAADLALLAQGVDVVTFTSSSTVENFVAALEAVAYGRYLPYLRDAKIACIGPKTAAAARDHGLTVTLIADPHTMEGLAQTLVHYFADGENED